MSTPAPRSAGRRRRILAVLPAALFVLLLARCVGGPRPRQHDELCAAGELVATGTPVVLWSDPGGYDAYQPTLHFPDRNNARPVPDGKLRYQARADLPDAIAARVAANGWSLADLQQVVHQFVVHFDTTGTSRQCFYILHDVRALSVHFMLDTDGTIYQTLDLQDQAWHATVANAGSIGIEIAHPGCYAQPLGAPMRRWYEQDELGWRMKFPEFLGPTGIRTPGFVPRPDRADLVEGTIHGKRYYQFDFTPEQYRALAHLCAALHRVFPRIRLDAPRDAAGAVVATNLPHDELRAFDGILGHYHVQANKQDPGPAFQWDRLLHEARALAGE